MTTPTRALAAIVAAGAVALLVVSLLLPDRPIALDTSAWRSAASRTPAGAYHVHTSRSDGAADADAVAAAAGRAGLQFVIFTDHGDGTRAPDPPAYRHGVLCIDGVEISTDDGHYVALGMRPAPYPLGGAASAVVEDVARLGGFGIAAHPDSPKESLHWRDTGSPIDGIEWLSADTEWRNESRRSLTRALIGYLVRPGPALAMMLDRPVTLGRWDAMVRTRRVVALAALDAHGGIGRAVEDGARRAVANVPSYEASFRTFSIRVRLDRSLTGDAAADGRVLLTAIREGNVFTVIDALAAPGLLEFYADTAAGRVEMGGAAPAGTPAQLVARVLAPSTAQVAIVDDSPSARRGGIAAVGASRRFAPDGTQELHARLGAGQGAFRVEVNLPSAPGTPRVPWLVSNPIYFLPPAPPAPHLPPATVQQTIDPAAWRLEKDPVSSATIAGQPPALSFRLAPGARASQYVALSAPLTPVDFSAVRVRLLAGRPMRVAVQLRRADGQRWRTSTYVDTTADTATIPATRFRKVEGTWEPFAAAAFTSVLLVVDLVNARPGDAGRLVVAEVALMR